MVKINQPKIEQTSIKRKLFLSAGRQVALGILMLTASLTIEASSLSKAMTSNFGARLLVAEKDGKMAFFLPEMHIGTPSQNDAYFKKTIRTAFAASSILLIEGASPAIIDKNYHHAACPVEDEAEVAIDAALNTALEKYALPVSPWVSAIVADGDLKSLGRFVRFDILNQAAIRHQSGAVLVRGKETSFVGLGAQSSLLMQESSRTSLSVDDAESLMQAYCALTSKDRVLLIAKMIDVFKQPSKKLAPMTVQEMRNLSFRSLDSSYNSSLSRLRMTLATPLSTGLDNSNYQGTSPASDLVLDK
ncbi:MAG: hypothetical protein K2Q15_01480, partial [Burkholderiales bacterium]|nr:hypothetical protein [Burkholderiales bacterium]